MIPCSCITQQKITFSYAVQRRKLFSRWQILSITIALVSSVTWKGAASQHQSPSRKTLLGRSRFKCWHADVFPTPIGPPMRYSFFMFALSDESFPRDRLHTILRRERPFTFNGSVRF